MAQPFEIFTDEEKRLKEEKLTDEEKKEIAGQEEEAEKEMTVQEILADKEKGALFGLMLEQGGDADKELAIRMVARNLEEADFKTLADRRAEFSEKMTQVEHVNEELTPEMVTEMGNNDPKLQDVIENVGSEGVIAAVQAELSRIAITDEGRFNKLSKHFEHLRSYKNDLADQQNAFNEFCDSRKFDSTEYQKVLAIADYDERGKAYSEVIRQSWGDGKLGSVRRGIDTMLFKVFSTRDQTEVIQHRKDIYSSLDELARIKKRAGSALSGTIGNDQFRQALSNELIGKKAEKANNSGFKECGDAIPSETDAKKLWEERKKAKKLNWAAMTDPQKDAERTAFAKEQKKNVEQKLKEKGGFWATIMRAMFEAMIDATQSKLD